MLINQNKIKLITKVIKLYDNQSPIISR